MGFIEDFERRVSKTIQEYGLVSGSEKVCVAVSGGKDSMSLLKVLHSLGYNVSAIHVFLGLGEWSERCRDAVEDFCSELGIELASLDFMEETGFPLCRLQSIMKDTGIKGCTACGVLRRSIINRHALGNCKRLATGHNLDDEAQTIVMNMFRGNWSQFFTSGPISGVMEEEGFVPRIKPFFLIPERDVLLYSKKAGIPAIYEPCPCSYRATRAQFRNFLDELEKVRPSIKEDVVLSFLKVKERYMGMHPKGKFRHCKICGQPCRGDICKACQIIQIASQASGQSEGQLDKKIC